MYCYIIYCRIYIFSVVIESKLLMKNNLQVETAEKVKVEEISKLFPKFFDIVPSLVVK